MILSADFVATYDCPRRFVHLPNFQVEPAAYLKHPVDDGGSVGVVDVSLTGHIPRSWFVLLLQK